MNNQKVDVLARNHFNKIIYGKEHPYGAIIEAEDFDRLELQNVKKFYKRFYSASNCKIVVSGLVKNETKKLIDRCGGRERDANGGEGRKSVRRTK